MIKFVGETPDLQSFSGYYRNFTKLQTKFKNNGLSLDDYFCGLTDVDSSDGKMRITGHKSKDYFLHGINFDRHFTIYLDVSFPEKSCYEKSAKGRQRQEARRIERKNLDKLYYKDYNHDNTIHCLQRKWEYELCIANLAVKQGYIWVKFPLGTYRVLTWVKAYDPKIIFHNNRYYIGTSTGMAKECRVSRCGTAFLIDEPKDKTVDPEEDNRLIC